MQIPDTGVYQMSWHIWLFIKPMHWFLGYFRQPCTLFILTYFYSFNFQLSTNKVVVVVLLPLVQKWTSGYPTNVDIFKLLCQLILWSYILVTGLLKVAKTCYLLCDVTCLLSYSHVSWNGSLLITVFSSCIYTTQISLKICAWTATFK